MKAPGCGSEKLISAPDCMRCRMFLRELQGEASVGSVDEPEEKPLQTASFVVHATRGLIRDQTTRRKAMFILLIVALSMLLAGSTFLQAPLNPREHPFAFLLFWIACGWLTLTALLLALFDFLMVRLESRRDRRRLHESMKVDSPGD